MNVTLTYNCGHRIPSEMPDDEAKLLGYTRDAIIRKSLKCPSCFRGTQDADASIFEAKHPKLPTLLARTASEENFARSARAQVLSALYALDSANAKKALKLFEPKNDPQFWIDALARKAHILEGCK